MMRHSYYIFVVAHSVRGRIRRIHIPQYFVYISAVFALIGFLTVMAAVGSYARMLLKVTNYNHLRREAELLKGKYSKLQATMSQTEVQLATLQNLASEVSVAYGIRRPARAEQYPDDGGPLSPALRASVEQYRLLLRASYTPPTLRYEFLVPTPGRIGRSLEWPLQGKLTGGFGDRLDPFNGEGSFHAGVDISSYLGAPVQAAGDGVVVKAERESGYGLVLLLDHGRGLNTFYAHLSGLNVAPGQQVLGGEIIGHVGRSGRSTGPHLHYEVRFRNTPVNPTRFLGRRPAPLRLVGDND
jgi:murein DD-endopeptidase MepM/ murein hydrolase activator NlpD